MQMEINGGGSMPLALHARLRMFSIVQRASAEESEGNTLVAKAKFQIVRFCNILIGIL